MANTTNTRIPAELAEIIAAHRALFGGYMMMADGEQSDPPADPPADAGAAVEKVVEKPDEFKNEDSKRAVLTDLYTERDARKQAEKALQDLQKQIDDASKSAEEKATEALTAAQKSATENAAKALRYEVAATKELPLSLASRLNGSTKEELEADADNLKKLLTPSGPKPDPSQGHGSDPKPTGLNQAVSAHYA